MFAGYTIEKKTEVSIYVWIIYHKMHKKNVQDWSTIWLHLNYMFLKKYYEKYEQTNKQTSKQTNKQTNKQTTNTTLRKKKKKTIRTNNSLTSRFIIQ